MAVFIGLGNALVGEPAATGRAALVRPAVRAIPLLRDAGFDLIVVAREPEIPLGTLTEEDIAAEEQSLGAAITMLNCAHCGCKITGHGVEAGGGYFCCAKRANMVGVGGLKGRT